MPRRRLASCFAPLALLCLAPAGCAMVKEVSVGYADAVAASAIDQGEGAYQAAELRFPNLDEVDPLSSPSLSRYEVGASDVESVKLTGVELEGAAGECGLPFDKVELQLVEAELGPTTLATATGGECLSWSLAETELAPWFRKPKVSVIALVDGQPFDSAGQSLSVRLSFLIDITDKPANP